MVRRLKYLSAGILLLWLLAGCRVSRVVFPEIDKADQNWLRTESFHYFIYYRPGSPASQRIEQIAKQLDSCFQDVLEELDVSFSSKISYYLYNSVDDLEKWAGSRRWGFFVGELDYAVEVYGSTGKKMNSHETVHVIAYHTVGISELIFLNEGLAEAVAHCHDRTPIGGLVIHKTCQSLLRRDRLFPLDTLTDNDRYKEIYLSPEVNNYYSQCGSLVRYLIDQYGLAKLKSLLPRADRDNYRTIFHAIYRKSIEDFEEEWREFLRDY